VKHIPECTDFAISVHFTEQETIPTDIQENLNGQGWTIYLHILQTVS